MNKSIKLNLSYDFWTPFIHMEAFRHSEENTDRAIVFKIYRTFLYSFYKFIQQKTKNWRQN